MAYRPGRRMASGFGKSAWIRIVPVCRSISRSATWNRPDRGYDAAVDEQELELRLVGRGPLLLGLFDLVGDAEVFALRDREGHLHRVDLRDGREHGRRGHEIADLDRCDPGDAVDRRVDLGPAQIEPGVLHGRLGCLDLGLARARRLHGVVELLLAHGPAQVGAVCTSRRRAGASAAWRAASPGCRAPVRARPGRADRRSRTGAGSP